MSKFTGGKWGIEGTVPFGIKSEASPRIAIVLKPEDARLIASAPEMYELLKVWTHRQAQPDLRIAQERARELLASIDGTEEIE